MTTDPTQPLPPQHDPRPGTPMRPGTRTPTSRPDVDLTAPPGERVPADAIPPVPGAPGYPRDDMPRVPVDDAPETVILEEPRPIVAAPPLTVRPVVREVRGVHPVWLVLALVAFAILGALLVYLLTRDDDRPSPIVTVPPSTPVQVVPAPAVPTVTVPGPVVPLPGPTVTAPGANVPGPTVTVPGPTVSVPVPAASAPTVGAS